MHVAESRKLLCWGDLFGLNCHSASDSCFHTFTSVLWCLSLPPTSTSTNMQAIEPGKKGSIVSLLNPKDSSDSTLPYSPVGDPSGDANQSHSHGHRTIGYNHTYPASDYSLRKATWEPDDRASHVLDEHHHHSQYAAYHQPSRMTTSHSPNPYYNHQPYHYSDRPIMRSDRVEERYFENGHHWQHHTYDSCHYGTPVTALSYSDANNGEVVST
jgi:hypothetical protein